MYPCRRPRARNLRTASSQAAGPSTHKNDRGRTCVQAYEVRTRNDTKKKAQDCYESALADAFLRAHRACPHHLPIPSLRNGESQTSVFHNMVANLC